MIRGLSMPEIRPCYSFDLKIEKERRNPYVYED